MSLNSVALAGNLTRDCELRSTPSGATILVFGIAVNERVKRGDEWVDQPNFFDIVMFGKRAESLSRILRKGMKVALVGRLRYSSWENKEGQKRSKVEVIAEDVELMQRRQEGSGDGGYANTNAYTYDGTNGPQNGSHGLSDGSDEFAQDDYPF